MAELSPLKLNQFSLNVHISQGSSKGSARPLLYFNTFSCINHFERGQGHWTKSSMFAYNWRHYHWSAQVILYKIKVLEVLRGRQLAHNSFYFAVLLQRRQPLKFDFVSNWLRKDFSSSDYCWIPECFFSCKVSIFTEGIKPHGDVETLLQRNSLPF